MGVSGVKRSKEKKREREGRWCVYLNAGPSMQPRRRLACESIIV